MEFVIEKNGLQTADDHMRYGLVLGVVWFTFTTVLVFTGLLHFTILLTNVMAVFMIGVVLINGLGHWRKFWRIFKPIYVVARPDHSTEEVTSWVKAVVDPMNYHQHNRSHVFAFRRPQDAVAFKLVWG